MGGREEEKNIEGNDRGRERTKNEYWTECIISTYIALR